MKRLATLAALTLFAVGCGGTGGNGTADTLEVTLSGLTEVGPDFVYEGWLIVDGTPVSAGRFDVTGDSYTYSLDLTDAQQGASTYVLTIEPAVGDDPAPSETHVLAGDFSGGNASLSVGHGAALGDDFTSAAGSYILATPTTAGISTDDTQGIWFIEPGVGATLALPTLPAGWVYEGWVVDANGPITTGRFLDPTDVDDDGAGPTAGGDGYPPVPGQDYITPALDLVGLAAVITIEPEPDNDPAPYAFKPLIDMNIEDIAAPTTQAMVNQATELATGSASLN